MTARPPAAGNEGGLMSSSLHVIDATPAGRELAARTSDGLHVRLLWYAEEDMLTVSVDESSSGQRFELAVERDRGLDAFYHPFAYADSGNSLSHDGERHTLDLSQQV